VREKASVINRLQKVLEWANLKLASVVSDISGVSARKILSALVEGQQDPELLANLARGRLRQKREQLEAALQGKVREHHCFLLASHLSHIDFLDEQIALFDDQIVKQLETADSDAAATVKSATLEVKEEPQVMPPLAWQEAVTLIRHYFRHQTTDCGVNHCRDWNEYESVSEWGSSGTLDKIVSRQ
jgi:transposase